MYEIIKNSLSNVVSFLLILLLCWFGYDYFSGGNNSSTSNTLTRAANNNIEAGRTLNNVASSIDNATGESSRAVEAVRASSNINKEFGEQLNECEELYSGIVADNRRAKSIIEEILRGTQSGAEQVENQNR